MRSDVAFSCLRISVNSFDQNASAVAFASLAETVYRALPSQVSVPAPGAVALIALAIARRQAS